MQDSITIALTLPLARVSRVACVLTTTTTTSIAMMATRLCRLSLVTTMTTTAATTTTCRSRSPAFPPAAPLDRGQSRGGGSSPFIRVRRRPFVAHNKWSLLAVREFLYEPPPSKRNVVLWIRWDGWGECHSAWPCIVCVAVWQHFRTPAASCCGLSAPVENVAL